ncbi:alpha/beta hydrolase [Nocardioides jiangxiensis]|uniref:Alpha/beta fold hydrolase n=1 Tax=Nocardioides jiangxiensis TaxID=3064524 RepID=A0ABT9AYJ8_9ACTN|nr:alpha/beta fold hydrolase [Nocardioides sp. WY-20]MDO7867044.1 alpha/beta fold hydrolase [Nocardioides sp. WY-20]
MSYASQTAWRTIQQQLPPAYRLTPATEPAEEWWEHEGHRIHLDAYRNPEAPVKVLLFHGVGTNGRQMTTILGRPLAARGYETVAVDMPTYGITEVAPGALVTYDDWVRIGSALVEKERDGRPIVLYGLSAGGMETFHIASLNGDVAGIVGMTFLDQSSARVRRETAFDPVTGMLGATLMKLLARTPLRRLRVPMRWVSKMRTLVNDPAAKKACYADRTSAGNSVTIAFLDSYLNYVPPLAAADFAVCPVLLTQPAADRWTPLHLSTPFLEQVTRVPVQTVMLENAGHYPLEQPGLDQMVDAIDAFCASVVGD